MTRIVVSLMIAVVLVLTPALAAAHKPPVPPPIVKPIIPAAGGGESALAAALTALGYAAAAGLVAYLIYEQYKHPGPPGFKGQQWDTCANAPYGSKVSKVCRDAGFLHR